jgi:ATP-dependent DNA helicase RecQ
MTMRDLTELLHTTFGHPAFRANQEAVCRAATDGRDVLLVMPTGAGKSLCYQLPAIAREGTALVISPLIALMDDQAAKLTAAGLRVARIHSGLSREDARQACRDYLDGTLNFLFVAPERMRVPGFPEMLARRKPSLIAIDEAHCISAWGHDFRPDYRTLGEHLPALRPAPVIALTATATPTVQQDIVAQLHLADPALFIHGFRRSNLAIEVVEMSKPRRHGFTAELLKDPAARPAIVYAPSRKAAEELAGELGHHFPAAAYHAGIESSIRERVQRDFQTGKLEVVVATIAFGMGIDKADVRTVVHTALPASVEAFYQEIGRAGRDGLPSRTVLLHSFADRKMHEFFLERDYPPASDLARVASVLAEEFLMPEPLAQRLKMDLDTFSKAIEKLIAQGAAALDIAGNVRRVGPASANATWAASYVAQIAFRRAQIDRMVAFAETQQCRMTALIRHFGDIADAHRPCGRCDFCSPATASAQTFAEPTTQQARDLRAILSALAHAPSRATGKLHTDLALGIDRKAFDVLLDALARSGLITLTSETFTNAEGKVLPYKKAALTHEGRSDDASELAGVVLPSVSESEPTSSRSRVRRATGSTSRKSAPDPMVALTPAQQQLDAALREWRKAEAAKTGKPAFIVLSDAVIRNLAIASPRTTAELLTVAGIGPNKADTHGAAILTICRGENSAAPQATRTTTRTTLPTEPPSSPRPARPIAEVQPALAFARVRAVATEPPAALTPDQQQLDDRLRAWRKAESERMGLPQFFVLGASTLRSIVIERPRTVAQLQSIHGIGAEKAAKFGPSIVELCNA